MKSMTKTIIPLIAFAMLHIPAFAQEKAGHSHEQAEIHGGEVLMSKQHHFEVVWMEDHVMVYLYDGHQKPLPAKGVTGEVTFKFKGGKTQKATLQLMEAGKMQEMMQHEAGEGHEHEGKMADMHKMMANQDHLVAKVDLGTAKEGEVKAVFALKGLPNEKEPEATFTATYKKMKMKQSHEMEHGEHEHKHE